MDKSGTDGFTLVVEGETYRITESEDRLRIAYPSGKIILGRWNGDELAGVESSVSSAIVAQDVELLGLAFQANGLNGEEETKGELGDFTGAPSGRHRTGMFDGARAPCLYRAWAAEKKRKIHCPGGWLFAVGVSLSEAYLGMKRGEEKCLRLR